MYNQYGIGAFLARSFPVDTGAKWGRGRQFYFPHLPQEGQKADSG
jgi:hypothetical protein